MAPGKNQFCVRLPQTLSFPTLLHLSATVICLCHGGNVFQNPEPGARPPWGGGRWRRGRSELPYENDEGVRNAIFVPLSVFSVKISTAGALAVPFRVVSRKSMTGDNVLCKN